MRSQLRLSRRAGPKRFLCLAVTGAVTGCGLMFAPGLGSAAHAAAKHYTVPKVVETKRVIVTLKIPTDSQLDADRIRTAQNRIIADLSRYPIRVVRRYSATPQIAIAIDAPGLAYLAQHPAVESVEPDDQAAPSTSAGAPPAAPQPAAK